MKYSTIVLLLLYGLLCLYAGLRYDMVVDDFFIILYISVRRSLIQGDDQHTLAKSVSTCFTLMTIPISLYQSYEHLSNFHKPLLQTQIIRVIWMV